MKILVNPTPSDTPTHTPPDDISKTETAAVFHLQAMAAQLNTSPCKKYSTTSPLAKGKIFHGGNLPTVCYTTAVKTDKESLTAFIVTNEDNDEQINANHIVRLEVTKLPCPENGDEPEYDREFFNSIITKTLSPGVSIVASVPCTIRKKKVKSNRIRGFKWGLVVLTKVTASETRVQFYSKMDIRGAMKQSNIDSLEIEYASRPTCWQEHFQHARKLVDLKADDGRCMALMLTNKNRTHMQRVEDSFKNRKELHRVEDRLAEFCEKNNAIKDIEKGRNRRNRKTKVTFPQIKHLLLQVLINVVVKGDVGESTEKVRKIISNIKSGLSGLNNNNKVDVEPAQSQDTQTETSASDATRIGKKFAMMLLTTTEPSAAVDSWLRDNKELEGFVADNIWFVPMMNTIAEELLQSSNLGLKWRVGLGAGLSIMDMITDAGVIKTYQASGNTSGANSLIAMIGSSLAVQLLIAYGQNIKKSKWVKLRELAFVVTFLKPGVDAYRVATGHEDNDTLFNPLMEMALGKGCEMALESIPGGLLQAYVLVNAPEKTIFLLISILISTFTTGFSSAMISFDMDVSVANRKEVPLFYGYIKDSNMERIITFILQVSEWSGRGVVETS